MKTLKTIIVLLTVFVAMPCFSQQKNIGLQLYSLRGDIGGRSENIDEIISAVGKMGYKYVETANYGNGRFYGMTPEEFKAKLAANGMFALSSHTGRELPGRDKPREITQANWDEIWAWWDRCIADHKAAGMQYIITPSMPTPETLEDLKVYCDYYNKIGEKCNAAGLKFGFHNHAIEFTTRYPDPNAPAPDPDRPNRNPNRIVWFDYMVENTDPAKVFFELDVYWAVMGQRSPVEIFKKFPGRFTVLHIKDQKELGESGMVGFEPIFRNIATAGTKYLIVEIESYDHPPKESVKMCIDYLNKADFVKVDYSK
jgi:sugar phosphate isomerase/epimerase